MSLSKDLSDAFNEKMQQTHDAKELDGSFTFPLPSSLARSEY